MSGGRLRLGVGVGWNHVEYEALGAEWKSRVYYPGVRTKEEAKIIELGDGEWRTDIDFTVPSANPQ